jgi:hypothetical protein
LGVDSACLPTYKWAGRPYAISYKKVTITFKSYLQVTFFRGFFGEMSAERVVFTFSARVCYQNSLKSRISLVIFSKISLGTEFAI